MPHLILEYTDNIREKKDLESLLLKLNRVVAETASADLESCKSRAVELKTYCVGNGDPKYAFVHLEVRLGAGRAMEVRENTAKETAKVLTEYFAESKKHLKLQITVESTEFPSNLYTQND
jgi:5-carboxymethyl-2-hydroxymuconate isomerase